MNTTNIYVFCPICEQKPLALREGLYTELLEHIESVHLPLRCRKCLRHYTKIDDLREFTKCVDLGHNCSAASTEHNHTCDTDASKVTVKKAAATTISTQTSPSIAKDGNGPQSHQLHQQQHLTPISLFNLRWKAKSRITQEEFISDSVSSIRNLSTDSVNMSGQQRLSIGPLSAVSMEKGKVIRSTSTPLQIYTMFAKPKETLTFNAGHVSSICHSGYVLDEQHTPAVESNSNPVQQPQQQPQHQQQQQQRAWKVTGRGRMSAVTPLRQVMSKSIQKAFVEHGGVGGMLAIQGEAQTPDPGFALDLRLSPVVRRTQSTETKDREHISEKPKVILLSAQKHTTESIIITRSALPAGASSSSASTTSTVYNSCESVEIITSSTSSSATSELSANIQKGMVTGAMMIPPITPITRIPGAVINKKLIKFDTPMKRETLTTDVSDEALQEDREIFYTPSQDVGSSCTKQSPAERRRAQIVPRQLTGQFSPEKKKAPPAQTIQRPQGPRARPPLRTCHNQKSFSGVQDVESDEEEEEGEEEVFLPNGASTHNDKKAETGRLWSIMSSVMRLPATLRGSDRNSSSVDKENTISPNSDGSKSLIRRCASIAGSLVRTIHVHDDFADGQPMKRKRTQTLDNQYCCSSNTQPMSPSSSSKRFRIQPRKPVERMRNT